MKKFFFILIATFGLLFIGCEAEDSEQVTKPENASLLLQVNKDSFNNFGGDHEDMEELKGSRFFLGDTASLAENTYYLTGNVSAGTVIEKIDVTKSLLFQADILYRPKYHNGPSNARIVDLTVLLSYITKNTSYYLNITYIGNLQISVTIQDDTTVLHEQTFRI